MDDLLLRNARLVNEGREFEGDLLVRHGRIERIAGSLEGARRAARSMPGVPGYCLE